MTINVRKFSIPEIFFGSNSLKYAGLCARRLGAEKIFFVSDPGLEKTGWVDKIFETLEDEKLNWVYYSNVVTNPRDYQVQEGAELYKAEGCDVVMALGGGSPMDAAKGVALVVSNGGTVHDYEGANRIQRPLPPMIFLPSTAGSGSDVSQFMIINDMSRHVKMSIISRTLVPNISIIDPNILVTKSRSLIIAAAIDALTHAIEAYVSRIASPFTEIQSLKAIELIISNLPEALADKSPKALENLSIAGTAAGMAFSNASLGLDHALAHSLGGVLDVMHGLIHPVLLPHVMRYNLPACTGKIADIGKIVLGKTLRTDETTALAGIEKLEEYCQSLRVATRLREIVPDRSQLARICQMAVYDSCLLTNPRSATWEEMLEICEEAW
ncbi:alcohol dehydrogenase [Desulfonema ishimotonii]|uniref:Alcohol dehydrogenase n=1 Tax=Desulfonema ishimotonii TaxID=45657 RepID=A0A401FRC0_9BACT|nr:iron-containing alcohol dehydrogenase [Desulfonema ishimotonii]GBC59503.1 alcohol dehydrogenase [Desulfonema ishimotonii]